MTTFPGALSLAPVTLAGVVHEVGHWQRYNFDGAPIVRAVGVGEEAGEVLRCVLKDHQGIRGTHEEWMAELAKELGDVFIKLADVADAYEINLERAIIERWASIRERDFRAKPIGHGLPTDSDVCPNCNDSGYVSTMQYDGRETTSPCDCPAGGRTTVIADNPGWNAVLYRDPKPDGLIGGGIDSASARPARSTALQYWGPTCDAEQEGQGRGASVRS